MIIVITLWLVSDAFVFVQSLTCSSSNSVTGHRLINHTLRVLRDLSPPDCFLKCEKTVRCQSYNYRYDVKLCELNKKTKDARPQDLIPIRHSYYIDRVTRVPLGSTAEASASSCTEIRLTNPNAPNGLYWIDESNTDSPALRPCLFHAISACGDLPKAGIHISDVYTLTPDDQQPIKVFCKMNPSSQKGWTMIIKRQDGSVDFKNRNWADYKTGVGNLSGEHWLGLENIHKLTKSASMTLRFEMEDWDGVKRYAEYSSFKVNDEADGYRLAVSGYSGDAGESFIAQSNSMKFSTPDRDNDASDANNCASTFSPWWHNSCHGGLPTGIYYTRPACCPSPIGKGITWGAFRTQKYSLKRIEMMIR